MLFAQNKVIAGDYKGEAVVSILGEVSIYSSSVSVLLNKDIIQSYELITDEYFFKKADTDVFHGLVSDVWPDSVKPGSSAMPAGSKRAQYIAILFKDGKKSLLEVDYDLCSVLIKNLVETVAHCGVNAEKIKSCITCNEGNCQDCPCFLCVLWPKCCCKRMHDRRAKYSHRA